MPPPLNSPTEEGDAISRARAVTIAQWEKMIADETSNPMGDARMTNYDDFMGFAAYSISNFDSGRIPLWLQFKLGNRPTESTLRPYHTELLEYGALVVKAVKNTTISQDNAFIFKLQSALTQVYQLELMKPLFHVKAAHVKILKNLFRGILIVRNAFYLFLLICPPQTKKKNKKKQDSSVQVDQAIRKYLTENNVQQTSYAVSRGNFVVDKFIIGHQLFQAISDKDMDDLRTRWSILAQDTEGHPILSEGNSIDHLGPPFKIISPELHTKKYNRCPTRMRPNHVQGVQPSRRRREHQQPQPAQDHQRRKDGAALRRLHGHVSELQPITWLRGPAAQRQP